MPQSSMQNAVLDWSRNTKRLVVVALDVGMALGAMWLAFTLRLDTLHWPVDNEWIAYGLAPILAVPVFVRFGLYRAILRYTGMGALIATAQAVTLYGAMMMGTLLVLRWQGVTGIPRSVGILQPLIFLLLVGFSRALARFWLSGLNSRGRRASNRLLIYGAGSAGAQTAAALGSSGRYALLAFVDDDPDKAGRSINDVQIYPPREVPELVTRLGVTDILLALPSAGRERRNQIIKSLCDLPVHIRTLPGLADLATGRVSVNDFRELDIEDLLGREPVQPNSELLAGDLGDKTILVTGAGGSIGSELCRQILWERPRTLLMVDHNEFGLYSIDEELRALCRQRQLTTQLVPLLGSVGNFARMSEICRTHRPDTIYHAAAYKHVPLVEYNPTEGIANNVIGTLHLARAALEQQVGRLVLISTDKAVRPTNLMGASKRVAELVLQALADSARPSLAMFDDAPVQDLPHRTVFSMVRFGNVLGSSGSVVPLFRKQIAAGGPVTVTHPEVTRYFMTISEAVQLVLHAGAMARGGEVFVLDMGEPVKILELARRMISLSGFTTRDDTRLFGDIEIQITGLRPGEKLYEELLIGEHPQPTEHPRIMKAREEFVPWDQLARELQTLRAAVGAGNVAAVQEVLHRLVSGYHREPAAQATPAITATPTLPRSGHPLPPALSHDAQT